MAVRIIMGRKSSNRVRIQSHGGATREMPVVPSEFSASGGVTIAQMERQGREALTRVDGPKKPELSFSVDLGYTDWERSIQSQVDWLETQRNEGRRIKFSGMPRQFSGWWMIDDMGVQVTRMTPNHQISRATLSFSLVAYLDFTGRARRMPTPPPKKPAAKKAKSPVYRYHTVVRGDWLSKLAARYLGDHKRWPEIYRLNKAQIDRRGSPDLIFPGQRFKIPPR